MEVWCGRGLSGQNDGNSRGFIASTANYPTVGQKEEVWVKQKESIKNTIMEDMELPADRLVSL